MDHRVEVQPERASKPGLKRQAEDEGDDERFKREANNEPKAGVKRNDDISDDGRNDKHQRPNDDDVNIDEIAAGLKLRDSTLMW